MNYHHLLATADEKWFTEWDQVQEENSHGSFFQYTAWLSSYSSFGVKSELLLILDDNSKILAGMTCQYLNVVFGNYYFCNWGPVILDSSNSLILEHELLKFFHIRGKEIGVVAQINLAFNHNTDAKINSYINQNFQKGSVLNKFYLPKHFNLIELRNRTEEEILSGFTANGRRDVRASERKGMKLKLAETEGEVEKAYSCFVSNALREGYFVRDWLDQKEMLMDLYYKKRAFFLMAYYQDNLVGAIWVGAGAKIMHYIMGGVERFTPDLLTGYFLQWHAMLLAKSLGCHYYNISVGGSSGVSAFKKRFNPKECHGPGVYFVVYSDWKFFFIKKIKDFAEKNKGVAVKVLRVVHRLKGK